MNDQRQVQLIVICGRRGSGKTQFSRKLRDGIGKKCLVIDTAHSPDFPDHHPISAAQLRGWKGGNAILFEGMPEENCAATADNAYNATVILEDAMRYISSNPSRDVMKLFVQSKQHNLDIIVLFHYVVNVPPRLMGFIDKLVLFKTEEGDRIQDTVKKFPNGEKVLQLHTRVMQHPDPYHCEVLNFR